MPARKRQPTKRKAEGPAKEALVKKKEKRGKLYIFHFDRSFLSRMAVNVLLNRLISVLPRYLLLFCKLSGNDVYLRGMAL